MTSDPELKSKMCVIVDGYSAGNLLAPEFIKRGYQCLHVQTTPEVAPLFLPSYRAKDYVKHFALTPTNDFHQLVAQLKPFHPACVIPGTETGVELADQLSVALNTPGNGTLKSEARRNKYKMVEACRLSGLEVAKQFKSANERELLEWFQKQDFSKVVVKPINSAGTDKVFVCTTSDDIIHAVKEILNGPNMLGLQNNEVLIQEFLEGTEYFIDAVSCQGKHHFTDIWKYEKRSLNGADCVYDNNTLCSSQGSQEKILQDYVSKVLTALDIKYGPTHTEVIMTANGPRLVEMGARLDGLSFPLINHQAIGYSPVELTYDAYLDHKAFFKIASTSYPLLKHAKTVYLTSYEEGVIESIPGEEKLKSLSSFLNLKLRVTVGSKIVKMTNYFTTPGLVWLAHEDPCVLNRELQLIRSWEKEKETLFKLY